VSNSGGARRTGALEERTASEGFTSPNVALYDGEKITKKITSTGESQWNFPAEPLRFSNSSVKKRKSMVTSKHCVMITAMSNPKKEKKMPKLGKITNRLRKGKREQKISYQS